MHLTGPQQRALEKALIDAFPSKAALERMLYYGLSKNLEAVAMGDNLAIIVFKLLQAAQAQGWIAQLIARAREANPGNALLAAFCQKIGLSPQPLQDDDMLERIVVQHNPFLDVSTWRQKLGELENQVCRVEISINNSTATYGTGFLVGPNLLLTNYHVMQAVIDGHALAQDVALRFDYKRLDNNTVSPGVVYRLASNWLVDCSPNSPIDRLPQPQSDCPNPDELDYALLRLKGSPGEEPVGSNPQPDAPCRGWIRWPQQTYTFVPGTPLLILQHPQAAPLKLAFETKAILALNENQTRVTYQTNTEPGSSGSPCFNISWNLIALHHSGDTHSVTPQYNQGIPISAIINLLRARGKI